MGSKAIHATIAVIESICVVFRPAQRLVHSRAQGSKSIVR
jgi:hypothetical protein